MTDYIRREDAIKVFDPLQRRDWYTPWIVETLEDLPSADVAPVRHGMWVDVDRLQMHDLHGVLTWGNSFMCTECNFKTFAVEGHMSQYHYCPNCGARMDKDGDD